MWNRCQSYVFCYLCLQTTVKKQEFRCKTDGKFNKGTMKWIAMKGKLGSQLHIPHDKQSGIFPKHKTGVKHWYTLSTLSSINLIMINRFTKQSPLLFWVMYVVWTRSNKDFVLVSSPMSRLNQWWTIKVRCQSLVGFLLILMVWSHLQYCLPI